MAANANGLAIFPSPWECQDSVTRPADTTAYAAGDGISDATTTATAAGYFELDFKTADVGGSIAITDFTLHKSDHDVTNATFWLLLFDAVPALTGFDDNAQLAITAAEFKNCKATTQFLAANWINGVTGDIQTVTPTCPIGVVLPANSTKLYGILVAGAAYTPASGEVFTLTVHATRY